MKKASLLGVRMSRGEERQDTHRPRAERPVGVLALLFPGFVIFCKLSNLWASEEIKN